MQCPDADGVSRVFLCDLGKWVRVLGGHPPWCSARGRWSSSDVPEDTEASAGDEERASLRMPPATAAHF